MTKTALETISETPSPKQEDSSMKVTLSHVCAAADNTYLFIKEGGYEPVIGNSGNIEMFRSLLHADCLEAITAWVGWRGYCIICDSEGRNKDRLPSVIDEDGNVALVGSIVIVGIQGHNMLELDTKYLLKHIMMATVSGRFCESDISDAENTYVLTDVYLAKTPEEAEEIRTSIWEPTVPPKEKGLKCLKRRKTA